jgi:hypothetical protein
MIKVGTIVKIKPGETFGPYKSGSIGAIVKPDNFNSIIVFKSGITYVYGNTELLDTFQILRVHSSCKDYVYLNPIKLHNDFIIGYFSKIFVQTYPICSIKHMTSMINFFKKVTEKHMIKNEHLVKHYPFLFADVSNENLNVSAFFQIAYRNLSEKLLQLGLLLQISKET